MDTTMFSGYFTDPFVARTWPSGPLITALHILYIESTPVSTETCDSLGL